MTTLAQIEPGLILKILDKDFIMSHSDSISENAPLLPEQRAALIRLMQELKPDQLLWLEGYISGLRIGRGDAPVSTFSRRKAPALTILCK